MNLPEHILLVDKPKGITSFDVIRRLRRELGIKKMGHAGTLDPLATGLMIIGVGPGTKLLNDYLKLPKTYIAEILIGESRTTGDLEGEIVEERDVSHIDEQDVQDVLKEMTGVLELPVPAYSAIKKDGQPLYKRARKGEAIELPIKQMEVRNTRFISIQQQENKVLLIVEFDVGSGTYIRSLAEALGRRLGYPATLANLRRTEIGEFLVKDARRVD